MADKQRQLSDDSSSEAVRKVRVHKVSKQSPLAGMSQSSAAALDHRISEIIPGLADLSLSKADMAAARDTAREVRLQRLKQQQEQAAELLELDDIYDFRTPNPVDTQLPRETWTPKEKPAAKKIVLSPYQYEMINYQRMLMRKNIWYYRCAAGVVLLGRENCSSSLCARQQRMVWGDCRWQLGQCVDIGGGPRRPFCWGASLGA
jgi:hypothetical protein